MSCDICDGVYCNNCIEFETVIECDVVGCLYCEQGNCRYSYVKERYCDNCIDLHDSDETIVKIDNIIVTDKITKLLEQHKYTQIFDLFGYTIKHYKTPQPGKCSICMVSKINCKTNCNHGFCIDCFIKNTIIYGKNECALCRTIINKNIKLYGILSK